MKLIRLRLENFRQHADSNIEFRDGMTAIVGPNGSGKTTLLEAITFALYGEQRHTKDSVRFYWAPPRKPFRVELTFEFDGKQYCVERGENDASLHHLAGEKTHMLAQSLRAVTAACERLTALNYEQFTNSFCAEQKGLKFLEFRNKAIRQDEIARMLGFDRLKLAAELGKDRVRGFKVRITALQEGLGNETELLDQVKAVTEQLKQATGMEKAAQERIAELDQSLPAALAARKSAEQYLTLLVEAKEIGAKAEGLKAAVKLTGDALESARLDAKELARLKPIEASYRQSEAELKGLDEKREVHLIRDEKVRRLAELEAALAEIETKLKSFGTPDLAALETSRKAVQKAHDEAGVALKTAESAWREDQQSAKSQLDICAERLAEARRQLDRAKDLVARGICPECGQSTKDSGAKALAAREAEVAEREAEETRLIKEAEKALVKPKVVATAEDAVREGAEKLEKARTALADGKNLYARLIDESTRKETAQKSAEALKKELAANPSSYDEKAHEAAKARLNSLQAGHVAYLKVENAESRVKDCEAKHETAQAQFDLARARYRELDEQRKQLGPENEAAAQTAIDAHVRLQGERQGAEKDLANARHLESLHQEALKKAEARIAEFKEKEAAIGVARNDLALHDTTANELLALREHLNRTIRPDLEARASDNLSLLTNGRYAVLRLDEDFQAIVLEDDIEKPVISGGEEDVVALSLRLALSELIQERQGRPMSLLILDEVFGSLDFERRQAVLDRLAAIKGRFQQILVISHIEEINLVADQCLYVGRDADSRAARVGDAPPEFQLVGQ